MVFIVMIRGISSYIFTKNTGLKPGSFTFFFKA